MCGNANVVQLTVTATHSATTGGSSIFHFAFYHFSINSHTRLSIIIDRVKNESRWNFFILGLIDVRLEIAMFYLTVSPLTVEHILLRKWMCTIYSAKGCLRDADWTKIIIMGRKWREWDSLTLFITWIFSIRRSCFDLYCRQLILIVCN